VNEDLEPIVFEFSGRIVAGTNIYLLGSPYLKLYWGKEMSVGRRIAKEIKIAEETNRLGEVVT
jgi:5-formaminoimidazole-4-carboxamide-1-(beta)-D-ribofuranosyl 5'-monophosphate synthetase